MRKMRRHLAKRPIRTRSGSAEIILGRIAHDRAFKEALVEFPDAAFRYYVGPAAAVIPPGTPLSLMREEQLSQILGKGHRISDAVIQAGPDRIYYLFDASKHVDRGAVFHVIHAALDMAQWLERSGRRFEITPVVVVIDPGTLDGRIKIEGTGEVFIDARALVRRLSELDGEAELATDNPVAIFNVMNMKVAEERRVEVCAQALLKLRSLVTPAQSEKYGDYLIRCARFNAAQTVELKARVTDMDPEAVRTLFDDLRDEGRAEGEAKGKAEGKAEGKAKGMADLLLRLLNRRRIKITAAQKREILACRDPKLLNRWFDAAIGARSAREVFGSQASRA